MFFVLSKILGFLAVPSNLLAVTAVAGVCLLLTRWRALAHTLLIGSIVMLAVLGFSPLSNVLLLSLTERFPAWQAGRIDPAGVIVLGGAIDPDVSVARGAIELDSSAERVDRTADAGAALPECARSSSPAAAVCLMQNSAAEAPFARQLLAEFGMTGEPLHLRGDVAHDLRECRQQLPHAEAEAGRAFPAGDVVVPHAAVGRRVPHGRLRGRGLSGRLADARLERCLAAVRPRSPAGSRAPTSPSTNGLA